MPELSDYCEGKKRRLTVADAHAPLIAGTDGMRVDWVVTANPERASAVGADLPDLRFLFRAELRGPRTAGAEPASARWRER